jgi:hypothetical protein
VSPKFAADAEVSRRSSLRKQRSQLKATNK